MDLLFPPLKSTKALKAKYQVSKLKDAIEAVHDVLEHARGDGSQVLVLCRSLHYHLREQLWHDATGSTFGQQLEAAINRGADVRVLLTNDLQAELLSSDVFGLAQAYPSKYRLLGTGPVDFFKTFPHFTLVRRSDGACYGYVEWKHAGNAFEPVFMKLDEPVDGTLYMDGPEGRKAGGELATLFDVLFAKADKAAMSRSDSGVFTAVSARSGLVD